MQSPRIISKRSTGSRYLAIKNHLHASRPSKKNGCRFVISRAVHSLNVCHLPLYRTISYTIFRFQPSKTFETLKLYCPEAHFTGSCNYYHHLQRTSPAAFLHKPSATNTFSRQPSRAYTQYSIYMQTVRGIPRQRWISCGKLMEISPDFLTSDATWSFWPLFVDADVDSIHWRAPHFFVYINDDRIMFVIVYVCVFVWNCVRPGHCNNAPHDHYFQYWE